MEPTNELTPIARKYTQDRPDKGSSMFQGHFSLLADNFQLKFSTGFTVITIWVLFAMMFASEKLWNALQPVIPILNVFMAVWERKSPVWKVSCSILISKDITKIFVDHISKFL